MPVTVGVNFLSVVHARATASRSPFPTCARRRPRPGRFPIPYPNIAKSSDTAKGTTKVKCDGNPVCVKDSNFSMSTGDEAGSAGGGVASNKIKGKAEFVMFSMDVKFEGKNVCRAFDIMLHNDKNTPPFPVLQGPVVAIAMAKPICIVCDKPI